MKIKKGGCIITTTESKYKIHYKRLGYEILKEKKDNIHDLNVRELRKIASDNEIENYTKLKKDELIKAIEKVI